MFKLEKPFLEPCFLLQLYFLFLPLTLKENNSLSLYSFNNKGSTNQYPLLKNTRMTSSLTQNQENTQTMMATNETQVQECPKDHISKLPDDLLIDIVSRLNCHERVLVETLSHRWRCFSLLSFSHLLFDEIAFHRHRLGAKRNFAEFVSWVLKNRNSSGFESVKLCCGFDFEDCLGYCLAKLLEKPRDSLDLCLGGCEIPSWLMSTQDGSLIPTLNFSYLKHLRLENVMIPFVRNLLYGFTFPIMESLVFDHCEFTMGQFFLSAPNLKTFRFSEGYDDVSYVILLLNTPVLISLSTKDYIEGEKFRFLDPLVALNDASIETGFNLDFNWQGVDEFSFYAFQLLKDLSHVRHLRVSANVLEVISYSSPVLNWETIKFSNLRNLSVSGWCTCGCFWSLVYLLMSSPSVEHFRLEIMEVNEEVQGDDELALEKAFEESKMLPEDMLPLQNLESVMLVTSHMGAFEIIVLKYLEAKGIDSNNITVCPP